jgi:hypothetical protein
MTNTFVHAGYTAVEAANRAQGELYSVLNQQAYQLSYLDCFLGLIVRGDARIAFDINNQEV